MYDFMIQTNTPLHAEEGSTLGGTERQILTVAEKLASEGCNVALLHSQTDGSDRIINDVKHLNAYRHHFAQSNVRLSCNHFYYMHNFHKGYNAYGSHIPAVSSLEINSCNSFYVWFHNWFLCHRKCSRIFNSEAVKRYVYEGENKAIDQDKKLDDKVIHYMVPKESDQLKPLDKRSDYLYWMSAYGKGLKEALLVYFALYENGMKRPFYISIPPQRKKTDVKVVENTLKDMNKFNYPIMFLGELNYQQAMKTLSNAACLFRPSSPQETFGLVYLEANQLGVPVITTEGDAGEEILVDKNNMFIRKNTHINDIQNWLENIQNKKTKVDMKKFDPDVIAKKWISLLK